MAFPYGRPYPVSPLIRTARWGLLVAGIFYGKMKQKVYNIKEEQWRKEEAEKKKIRDKELAILKAKIAKEERETVKLLESGKLFETEGSHSHDDDYACKPKKKKKKPKKHCD